MKIFIDFDDVLFNTKQFKEDYFNLFKQKGISREVFEECYYDTSGAKNSIREYNPLNHIKRVCEREGIDSTEISEEISIFVRNTEEYVFEGVKFFMESFPRNDLFLVSYSKTDFQQAKIGNSGITRYFRRIEIVNELKSVALLKIIAEENIDLEEGIFFIDDRVEHIADVKEKISKCATILMHRQEGRYQDKRSGSCDFEAKNLGEVAEIISRQHGKSGRK